MKQIVSNYSYSPTTNVVTLTGVNIEQDQLLLVVAPQVGRTMYNFASGVTGSVVAGTDTRVTLNASTVGLTTTSPLVIFYDDQLSTQTIAGTVTANPTGTQTIAGTVTANLSPDQIDQLNFSAFARINDENGNPVNNGNPLPISGTVTANLASAVTINSSGASFSNRVVSKSELKFEAVAGAIDATVFSDSYTLYPLKITAESQGRNLAVDLRTTVTGNDLSAIAFDTTAAFVRTQVVGGSVTIGSLPRVTFIDGSGTVVTANSAVTLFASSTTRSYLLVQVTTGSAFVNVGATATTVNGINLTAGQGYAWEKTIPQGLVSLISTTTSSRWVAKEA